jgi:hypothetical protein
MLNPFLKHPAEKGLGYFSHFKKAFKMGFRLLISGSLFIIHSIFPFIPIPKKYNCHEMVHAFVSVAEWK